MGETWIGTVRRQRYVRYVLIAVAAVAIVSVVLRVFSPDWFAMRGGVTSVAVFEAMLVVFLLVNLRVLKPVTVTISANSIVVIQDGERLEAALADLTWRDPLPGDAELVLEQLDDPLEGPRAALRIDLASFTKVQRTLLLDHLSRCISSFTAGSATPRRSPAWARSVQEKSWRSRSSFWARLVLAALLIVLLLGMTGFVMSSFDNGSAGATVPFALLLTILGTLVLAYAFGVYGSLTVAVDVTGIRLTRGRRSSTIAFADIASLTIVHTGDPGVTPGHLADNPYLLIVPKPDYYVRTGTRRPTRLSLKWRIYRERFTRQEFGEMRSFLTQGVHAAGGKWIPEE